MDKNLAGAIAYASGVSARRAAFELEVYERAVTRRAAGGEVCLITAGFTSAARSGASARIGSALIGSAQVASALIGSALIGSGSTGGGWFTGQIQARGLKAVAAQAPSRQTLSPQTHKRSTFTVFTGMDDVQVSKPRTGYRVPRDTG